MRSFLILITSFLFFSSLSGQILEPVKWDIRSEALGGDEHMLIFTAKMDKGWTVYSQFTSDEGPVPTSINYESEGFETIGKAVESGKKKEGMDKLFEVEVIKFLADEPFVIKQKVKAPSGTEITGYLTYMTCDKEKCLPPTDVDFSLKLESKAALANDAKAAVEQVKEKKTLEKKISQPKVVVNNVNEAIDKSKATVQKAVNAEKGINVKVNTPTGNASNIKVSTPVVVSSGSTAAESEPQNNSQGGLLNPVSWTFDIKKLSGDEYELIYTATMDDPWTVYSQFTSDDGPVPTYITYETKGVEKIGDGEEIGHKKEGMDKLFEVNVIKFLPDEPFVIKHKIKSKDAQKIKGYLTYMTCDAEKCLPPTDVEFGFDLKNATTIPYKSVGAATAGLQASAGPSISGDVLDQKIPQLVSSYKNPVGKCEGGEEAPKTLLMSFIFGFIGGLLALLTPCVFPMIPLTVSFFTKDTKRKGWVNGLIYGASIIVIYVALGLIVTAVFGEEALNKLSTNWIANTLFFIIFIVFAFSFFGFYEITLPSSWSTKTDGMADKGGLIGIFFMAFTLALVSFSCTGPIIGTAIVQSATNAVGPAIVMLGFSLALALPFGLFAAIPAALNKLPQSGGWMNSVKVVLGFLELALAFKFLSVADMTENWGFLRYEIFMGAWVIIFALMAIYLFGKIKFPHDSPIKKLSPTRMGLAILTTLFTGYLATGFLLNDKTKSYNSLGVMSGLAPPSNYNYFLPELEPDKSIKDQYKSYTMCANGIPCFKDYYEGKAYAASIGKPVFMDFTGYGCVNCRKTEEHIWIEDEIRDKLINDWVLVSLYVDDRKKLKKTFKSKHRPDKIRNVGNKWTDFQVINFEQNSQPLYVMMTPDEKVLAKPRGYKEGVDGYREYMECGMETFKSIQ